MDESHANDVSSLLSNADIAVLSLDTHFRIRLFTPAMKDLMELTPSDVGRPLKDLALKFHDPQFLSDVQLVLDKLVPLEQEVASESGRFYLRRVLPYRTADNRIEGVVITFVDITRRREAEASLRESEQRYRLILDGVKEYAICMLDTQGRFATWPAGAERVLGYSTEEALGRTLDLLLTPEDRAAGVAEQQIDVARREGSCAEDRWHLRKNATRFWGSGILAALKDETGNLCGFVKVLHDNTDKKISEEALKEAKAAAEAANASKDHFLATVSHELRTPLAAMMLWTKLLEEQQEYDEDRLREGLEAIRNCAEEQQELIEDLVDTSRIVAGKLRLELKPMNLVATVRSAVDAVRPAASSRNISIDEQIEAHVGWVNADQHRIQQVVWNLLTNSVKFTEAGGRITIGVRRRSTDIEIRVADNGIGISPEFIGRVFERFGQAEQSSTRIASGLGLGLSICKQLVELHGGKIIAQSPGLGHGATFSVWLPLPPVDSSSIKTGSNSPIDRKANLAGQKVMLVEDMAATRRALALVLREGGAEVVAFDRATDAIEEFKQRPPDLIVSDIGMPAMDGHQFIEQVRQLETRAGGKNVPAVALTAFADDRNKKRALASGFQKCLTKPIEPRQLIAALAKFKNDK